MQIMISKYVSFYTTSLTFELLVAQNLICVRAMIAVINIFFKTAECCQGLHHCSLITCKQALMVLYIFLSSFLFLLS